MSVHPDPTGLSAVPLLASLGPEELERISGWMEVRHADAGERLVSEGASGYAFFILQEGAAVVTRGAVEIATLGQGDFFGELALAGDGRRTATVTATSSVTLAAMFGSEFRLLERELPATADRIRSAAADRRT